MISFRITVEHAKGPRRDAGGGGGGRGGDRDRRGRWVEKYGPPTRTDYRVVVSNLSSRVSWQVMSNFDSKCRVVTHQSFLVF